jgi:hypothetical protein
MKTTPSDTNTPAEWRHVTVGSCVYRNRGMYPGGIDSVAIGATHAKSFTATTNGRPTRRGAPPH